MTREIVEKNAFFQGITYIDNIIEKILADGLAGGG